MNKKILIGNMNSKIYAYDIDTQKLSTYCDTEGNGMMGLARDGEHLFVSSREMVMRQKYPFDKSDDALCMKFPNESPQFHQMMIHHGEIYLTCTLLNEIWVFSNELKLLGKRTIRPPNAHKPVELKVNYNHLNSICFHKDRFYVGLNWLTLEQYGKSGVCVLDTKLRELRRFPYSWEMHGFTFVDGKQYALCASSKLAGRVMGHPLVAGLIVEDEVVFEHSTDVFCKAFVVSDDHIYLLGGDVAQRDERKNACGFIYILDRTFNLLDTLKFEDTGQFCGGLLL